MSPEEDRTRDTVDSEPKHYQLSYSGPLPTLFKMNHHFFPSVYFYFKAKSLRGHYDGQIWSDLCMFDHFFCQQRCSYNTSLRILFTLTAYSIPKLCAWLTKKKIQKQTWQQVLLCTTTYLNFQTSLTPLSLAKTDTNKSLEFTIQVISFSHSIFQFLQSVPCL